MPFTCSILFNIFHYILLLNKVFLEYYIINLSPKDEHGITLLLLWYKLNAFILFRYHTNFEWSSFSKVSLSCIYFLSKSRIVLKNSKCTSLLWGRIVLMTPNKIHYRSQSHLTLLEFHSHQMSIKQPAFPVFRFKIFYELVYFLYSDPCRLLYLFFGAQKLLFELLSLY